MKAKAKYDDSAFPPRLVFEIQGAPHERMSDVMISSYRVCLFMACFRADIEVPIRHKIDLVVTFVNPTSPDLDHLLVALYRALDSKTLDRKFAVLEDDGLIQHVTMGKFYPADLERSYDAPAAVLVPMVRAAV